VRAIGTRLEGRTVLVATPMDRAAAIGARLRACGARAIEFPTARIEPPSDFGPLDRALRTADPYDWAVFTSVHGVHAVVERCRHLGIDPARIARRIAAVGPATATALRDAGLRADFVPDRFVTDAIPRGLAPVAGTRILLARSDLARPSLREALRRMGADVEEVVAYRTVPSPPATVPDLRDIDIVVFTSASSARFLRDRLGPDALRELRSRAVAACIGPVTAEAARELGLPVATVAREHTVDGLIEALLQGAAPDG
jgi:uroporphyrinogen-III synthase